MAETKHTINMQCQKLPKIGENNETLEHLRVGCIYKQMVNTADFNMQDLPMDRIGDIFH